MRVLQLLAVALAIWPAQLVRTQNAVDSALSFYAHGGAYCFRIVPSGTALADETAWTVMMLTSASNHRNRFRIRSVDPGQTGLSGAGLMTAGRLANDVWKFDGTRADFFERFAQGIAKGELRARVVNAGPPNLAQLPSARERADLYLEFADKGTRVSFDAVADLTPEQFMRYADYLPD